MLLVLKDLANKITGHPTKFQFQINNAFFSISMSHSISMFSATLVIYYQYVWLEFGGNVLCIEFQLVRSNTSPVSSTPSTSWPLSILITTPTMLLMLKRLDSWAIRMEAEKRRPQWGGGPEQTPLNVSKEILNLVLLWVWRANEAKKWNPTLAVNEIYVY